MTDQYRTRTSSGDTHDPSEDVRGARDDIRDASHETQRAAEEVAGEAKRVASDAAGDLRDEAAARADEARRETEKSAHRVADELDRAAANVREDDQWAQNLLHSGASSLRTVADYLSANRIDALMRDGERFARQNPAAYLGASVAAGFLLARLGKTATARASQHTDAAQDSGAHAYEERFPTQQTPATGGAA